MWMEFIMKQLNFMIVYYSNTEQWMFGLILVIESTSVLWNGDIQINLMIQNQLQEKQMLYSTVSNVMGNLYKKELQ